FPPVCSTRLTVSAAAFLLMSFTTTLAPSAPKARAYWRPSPPPAPVTITTRSLQKLVMEIPQKTEGGKLKCEGRDGTEPPQSSQTGAGKNGRFFPARRASWWCFCGQGEFAVVPAPGVPAGLS